MRSAMRMSAISNAGVIYVMTHDSVAVGEDGPTHQPVEHIASLRLIPNLLVIRPADGKETAGAYEAAVERRDQPSVLILSRQKTPNLEFTAAKKVKMGAYVYSDSEGPIDLILIGTGTELTLCANAAERLREEGLAVRVVSMPCWRLFDAQDNEYKESVLPKAAVKRLAVEAGTSFGWNGYVGAWGSTISIDRFGVSAPGNVCLQKFGYTVENVTAKAKELLEKR
jgi:transketolase